METTETVETQEVMPEQVKTKRHKVRRGDRLGTYLFLTNRKPVRRWTAGQAAVVIRVFTMVMVTKKGKPQYSPAKIAEILNSLGRRTKTGATWTSETVREISAKCERFTRNPGAKLKLRAAIEWVLDQVPVAQPVEPVVLAPPVEVREPKKIHAPVEALHQCVGARRTLPGIQSNPRTRYGDLASDRLSFTSPRSGPSQVNQNRGRASDGQESRHRLPGARQCPPSPSFRRLSSECPEC